MYSECVPVALVIQHAEKRMRRIVLSSAACPLYRIIPHYLINGKVFEKKVSEHKPCVLIFSTTFV
jgi:hypothetical protein